MKAQVLLSVAAFAFLAVPASLVAADSERTVKKVQFAKGSSSAVIRGRISGYNYIDYQLRAEAGQRMKVTMQVTNLANYYNILPPGSPDAAMYVGELGENRFDGLLPDDGAYTVRVYLMPGALALPGRSRSSFAQCSWRPGRGLSPASGQCVWSASSTMDSPVYDLVAQHPEPIVRLGASCLCLSRDPVFGKYA